MYGEPPRLPSDNSNAGGERAVRSRTPPADLPGGSMSGMKDSGLAPTELGCTDMVLQGDADEEARFPP